MQFRHLSVAFVLTTVTDMTTTVVGIGWFELEETTPPAARVLSAAGLPGLLVTTAVVTVLAIGISMSLPRLHERCGRWLGQGLLAYGTVLKTIMTVNNAALCLAAV